jgi:hypothetical protein
VIFHRSARSDSFFNPLDYARNPKYPAFVDDIVIDTYSAIWGARFVRDIYEVLRKKQAEQAQLGKQIEALQTAAEQLRSVAHLLNTEDEEEKGSHHG